MPCREGIGSRVNESEREFTKLGQIRRDNEKMIIGETNLGDGRTNDHSICYDIFALVFGELFNTVIVVGLLNLGVANTFIFGNLRDNICTNICANNLLAILGLPHAHIERLNESLRRQLYGVVEAPDSVLRLKGVVEVTEYFGLGVIGTHVVSIHHKNLQGREREYFLDTPQWQLTFWVRPNCSNISWNLQAIVAPV